MIKGRFLICQFEQSARINRQASHGPAQKEDASANACRPLSCRRPGQWLRLHTRASYKGSKRRLPDHTTSRRPPGTPEPASLHGRHGALAHRVDSGSRPSIAPIHGDVESLVIDSIIILRGERGDGDKRPNGPLICSDRHPSKPFHHIPVRELCTQVIGPRPILGQRLTDTGRLSAIIRVSAPAIIWAKLVVLPPSHGPLRLAHALARNTRACLLL